VSRACTASALDSQNDYVRRYERALSMIEEADDTRSACLFSFTDLRCGECIGIRAQVIGESGEPLHAQ
jgi:hypothetical protein